MNNKLDISVVVPLYNEAESLPELVAWIDRVAVSHGYAYEVILVDDGSSDGSWEVVESLREKYPAIRGIGFARNYGKSAALYCGFAAAEGEVVITMDADLQDSPDEIPELRRMILEEGYDLVSGWKKKRRDPVGKRMLLHSGDISCRLVLYSASQSCRRHRRGTRHGSPCVR